MSVIFELIDNLIDWNNFNKEIEKLYKNTNVIMICICKYVCIFDKKNKKKERKGKNLISKESIDIN